MNRTYAQEWLHFAQKNLSTAQILTRMEHYTDIIGSEVQQSVEKSLKALLAYHNLAIPKTHDLTLLAAQIKSLEIEELHFDDETFDILDRITLYYKFERYPNPNYFVPSREEMEESLQFAEDLFSQICEILHIDIDL
jgi:HEPN domain-containing protein